MSRYPRLGFVVITLLLAVGSSCIFAGGLPGASSQEIENQSDGQEEDAAQQSPKSEGPRWRTVLRIKEVPYSIWVPADTPRLPGEVIPGTEIAEPEANEIDKITRYSISTGDVTILLDEFTGGTWRLLEGRWVEIPREPGHTSPAE